MSSLHFVQDRSESFGCHTERSEESPQLAHSALPLLGKEGIDGKFSYYLKFHSVSRHTAVASPPPIQIPATPRFFPKSFKAEIRVITILVPEAPIGWPSAIAPPKTLSLS